MDRDNVGVRREVSQTKPELQDLKITKVSLKTLKKIHIEPFFRDFLDKIFVYKSEPLYGALSEPILNDINSPATTILKEMAVLKINELYNLQLTVGNVRMEISQNTVSFCKNPHLEKNLLLSVSFGKNSIHFLPFGDNRPIISSIVKLPLEDGCFFILSPQATGVISNEGHFVRIGFGEDVVAHLLKQFEIAESLIPKLINCKIDNLAKIGFTDLKNWTENSNNLYIGRKGIVFIDEKETGKKRRFPDNDSDYADRTNSLTEYRAKLREKTDKGELNLLLLTGKTLGCWCSPSKCHGNILIEEYIRKVYSTMFFS